MTRRKASGAARRQSLADIAFKLIAIGAALAIGPLFLGGSPITAGLRLLAPLGWLLLSVGGALLWWQRHRRQAAPFDVAKPHAKTPSKPVRRPPDEGVRVDPVLATQPALQPSTQDTATASPVPEKWGPEVFDVIEWRRFEALIEALYAQAGFETKSQSHGADEGVDIWLYSRNKPGEAVSIVQCKHWQGKRVGVDKVRELRGVMAAKNVARGQFATTSTFTADAQAFAKDNAINLLDVRALLAVIAQRSVEQQAALLKVALQGDHARPTCVNCGLKMVERKRRNGGAAFWGCSSYPRCKTTMPMRGARTVA